jgi:hypothetical protein
MRGVHLKVVDRIGIEIFIRAQHGLRTNLQFMPFDRLMLVRYRLEPEIVRTFPDRLRIQIMGQMGDFEPHPFQGFRFVPVAARIGSIGILMNRGRRLDLVGSPSVSSMHEIPLSMPIARSGTGCDDWALPLVPMERFRRSPGSPTVL